MVFGYKIVLDIELGKGKELVRVKCSDPNIKRPIIINALRDAADDMEKEDILVEVLEKLEKRNYGTAAQAMRDGNCNRVPPPHTGSRLSLIKGRKDWL